MDLKNRREVFFEETDHPARLFLYGIRRAAQPIVKSTANQNEDWNERHHDERETIVQDQHRRQHKNEDRQHPQCTWNHLANERRRLVHVHLQPVQRVAHRSFVVVVRRESLQVTQQFQPRVKGHLRHCATVQQSAKRVETETAHVSKKQSGGDQW